MLIHDTVPDADGWVSATVVNRGFRDGRALALQIRYRKDQLLFLVQWRNFRERGGDGRRASNADVRGRAFNRERGTLTELAPATAEYHLEVEVANDPSAKRGRYGASRRVIGTRRMCRGKIVVR